MPKSHPQYPAEFRARMVELVRSGRSPEGLAKEFEPSSQAIRNWVRQADVDEGRRADGLTSAERDELVRIHRQVARGFASERGFLRAVFQKVSGHPVILARARQVLNALSKVATV